MLLLLLTIATRTTKTNSKNNSNKISYNINEATFGDLLLMADITQEKKTSCAYRDGMLCNAIVETFKLKTGSVKCKLYKMIKFNRRTQLRVISSDQKVK